jgi:hypothetical protein
MAKSRYGTFAEVAAELGITLEDLNNDVVDGKRTAIGDRLETWQRELIPWEYFTYAPRVPSDWFKWEPDFSEGVGLLVRKRESECRLGEFDSRHWNRFRGAGANNIYKFGGIEPPDCRDVEEGVIFVGGVPVWVNIKVQRLDNEIGATAPKFTEETAAAFVAEFMEGHPKATQADVRRAATATGKWRRELIDAAYKNWKQKKGESIKPGPRGSRKELRENFSSRGIDVEEVDFTRKEISRKK